MNAKKRWLTTVLGAWGMVGCVYPPALFQGLLGQGDVTGVAVGTPPGTRERGTLKGTRVTRSSSGTAKVAADAGRFVLRNLPEGKETLLLTYDAESDGVADLAARVSFAVASRAGRRASVDLGEVTLGRTGRITGRVTVGPGVLLDVLGQARVVVNSTSVSSSVNVADGAFELGGLAPGKWEVMAVAPGHGVGPVSVDVREGEATTVDLQLVRWPVRDGFVQGELMFPPGVEPPGVQAVALVNVADGVVTQVDSPGVTFLRALSPGLYVVEVDLGDDWYRAGAVNVAILPDGNTRVSMLAEPRGGTCEDQDGDQKCFLRDDLSACAVDCRRRSASTLEDPCTQDGVTYDCDDDADGEADVLEMDSASPCRCSATGAPDDTPCVNNPLRADRDRDGICDVFDVAQACTACGMDGGVPDSGVSGSSSRDFSSSRSSSLGSSGTGGSSAPSSSTMPSSTGTSGLPPSSAVQSSSTGTQGSSAVADSSSGTTASSSSVVPMMRFVVHPPMSVVAGVPFPAGVTLTPETPGVMVSLDVDGAPAGSVTGNGATPSNNGSAAWPSVVITHAAAGLVLRASAPGFPDALSATVDVLAGPADAARSSLNFDRPTAQANGVDAPTATLLARDTYGNALPGASVNLMVMPMSAQVVPAGPWTTDANGQLQVSVTSTTPGMVVLEAVVNGTASVQAVTDFQRGVQNLEFGAMPAGVQANVPFNISVSLVDAMGMPISGSTDEVELELLPNAANAVMYGNARRALSAGTATFALTISRAAATLTLRATLVTDPTVSQVSAPLTVAAGPAFVNVGARGNGFSGRFTGGAGVDPNDRNTIYIGTDAGMFRSRDGGLTWQAINTGLSGQYKDPLVFSQDGNTLFLGTNTGLFTSTNQGDSWSALRSGVWVLALAVDPFDDAVMYAAFNGQRIWKSGDRGVTWNPASVGLPAGMSIPRVFVHPTLPNVVMATNSDQMVGGQSIFRSDDAATTWVRRDTGLAGPGVSGLAISHTAPGVMVANGSNFAAPAYVTLDGAMTWTAIPGTSGTNYSLALPSGPLMAFGGGGVRSDDNGMTWQPLGFPEGTYQPAYNRNDENHIIIPTFASVYISTTGGR